VRFPGGLGCPSGGTLLKMGRKPFRLRRLLSRSFTADRTAPGAARLAIDQLNGHIDPALKDDVRLLVSEVVTNSVVHAQPHSPGEVALDVWASEEVVRVAITDRGPGFVAAELPSRGEGSGWGLMMVDRLAHRWGVELDDGTEVWFEFRQESSSRAPYREPAAVVTASADGV
jgi:anti-sigma regulatory factor (Ser/Thr protein kinase)